MVLLDELRVELVGYRPQLKELGDVLQVARAQSELDDLRIQVTYDGFWDDAEKSQKVMQKIRKLENTVDKFRHLNQKLEDTIALIDLCMEEDDDSSNEEILQDVESFKEELEAEKLSTLLTGEYDGSNAILTFHAGAGGTEAQDWAQMLQRMYLRWADSHGFSVEELDFLPGDEAGIKSVSLRISGENVYGFLKGERGIHRLIRISPFDSSGRRHTSFASVDVIPDAGDDIEIEIKESDLRVDIFCASGPGGQGVNTTYSAVRITHIPSGISVQCQNERSQHHNKDSAMRILRGRLYDLELSKRDAARQAEYAGKNAISFGSQIRTYTLQPYRLVKDHRNNCEIGDTDAVLDGRIDKLLRDYLLWQHANRQQQQQ